jgi:uncharacterized repeat protein (TIGR03803 family)
MQSHRAVAGVRWTITLLFVIVVYTISARAVTEMVLHSFAGPPDGIEPWGSVVLDASGNLYGTTRYGGTFGNGMVFELTLSGGVWTETMLYSFTGGPDGWGPLGGLILDTAGNLYGTTVAGGNGQGVAFELSPLGGSWTEKAIYTFGNTPGDGCNPSAGLTIDSLGNLYGTNTGCGVGYGTVFELTPSSGGTWTEAILWAFTGLDGASPEAGVVLDNTGNLYGTTYSGGFYGGGSVFKLSSASGNWMETSIFSFTGGNNGCNPNGDVILDKTGYLYGTTQGCGSDNVGTVFELTPTQGQWDMSVLHTFTGGIDGGRSDAGLKFDSAGNLYGTTQLGGLFGNGTVFRLNPKCGTCTEAEYSFIGGTVDGANPYAGVTFGRGAVYGTTWSGGTTGQGTVYEITAK